MVFLIFLRYVSTRPDYYDGDRIRIYENVLTEPLRFEKSQYFKLEDLKIYLPKFPEITYGDFVVIEGQVDMSDKSLKSPKLIEIRKSGNFLYKFRQRLISFYQKSLPEPHSSLIAGVTIGSKSSIDNAFWEKLRNTGTAHIVVASGMNVSLVAGFLIGILIVFLSRKTAVTLSLFGIWIYALVSGLDAPIIRAAIMGSISFLAVLTGRVNLSLRALFLSALIMLLISPGWIKDLGFLLSFSATASIIIFEAKIRKKIKKVPYFFREGLSSSLAAQIGVFPILYYSFGYFNPLSPLINALILWTIPIMTFIGMSAGLIGVIIEPLGRLILYFTYPLTSYFFEIIRIFS